jgi:hypothetical protein
MQQYPQVMLPDIIQQPPFCPAAILALARPGFFVFADRLRRCCTLIRNPWSLPERLWSGLVWGLPEIGPGPLRKFLAQDSSLA